MKIVITYGTFDLFHYGHWSLLKRASEFGDYLIVGLSTDKFNRIKRKKSFDDYKTRKERLESLRFVDRIIPEDKWEQKISDIYDNNVDIFIMGDDWEGKFDFLKESCSVVYLKRTPSISSTKIKELLNE